MFIVAFGTKVKYYLLQCNARSTQGCNSYYAGRNNEHGKGGWKTSEHGRIWYARLQIIKGKCKKYVIRRDIMSAEMTNTGNREIR